MKSIHMYLGMWESLYVELILKVNLLGKRHLNIELNIKLNY